MPTKSKRPAPKGDGPLRTCVVTREVLPQRSLLRVALLDSGEVVVDRTGRIGGRGAWVKPERALLEQLEHKPGLLGRALQAEGPIVTAGLLTQARAQVEVALLDLLSLSSRAGCLASGAEQVTEAVRSGNAVALITASDASAQSVEGARKGGPDVPCFILDLDRETLGRRIGKGPRAVVAIRNGGPSRALLDQLRLREGLR